MVDDARSTLKPRREMVKMTNAARTARIILSVSALFLPSLSLLPLGGMYLWEKGWLLPWALAALVVSVAVFLSQRWLLSPPAVEKAAHAADKAAAGDARIGNGWTPAEAAAWQEVQRITAAIDVDKLSDADSVLALGQRTLDAVSRKLHPEKADAVWQFTLPEALAIVERVSRRLGRFTVTNIPFGDRLTVAQVLRAYSWRGFVGVAERAYDVWRVLRIANPATAVTHEARERLSKAVLAWGREHVSRRFAEAYVEEVGRAAIDLYGGRLRVAHGYDASVQPMIASSATSHVSLLIVGADEAMRRQLAALIQGAQADHARAVVRAIAERDPAALGQPAPPTELIAADIALSDVNLSRAKETAELIAEARQSDIVVWIIAPGGVPETDFAAAGAIAQMYRNTPSLIPPVLLPIIVDAPAAAGRPAGSVDASSQDEARALAAAFGAIGAPPLLIGLGADSSPKQRAAAWAAIERALPAALEVRALRRIEDLKATKPGALGTARQAVKALGNAARSILLRRGG